MVDIAFLCLDHVVPCGIAKRKEQGCAEGVWRDALRRNFPPDYQLLCYNCNCAKAFNPGGCPHKIALDIPEPERPTITVTFPDGNVLRLGRNISEETIQRVIVMSENYL